MDTASRRRRVWPSLLSCCESCSLRRGRRKAETNQAPYRLLFVANTVLAIVSVIPSKTERMARRTTLDSKDDAMSMKFDPPPMTPKQRAWGAKEHYAPEAEPFTPRTTAFNRLASGSGSGSRSDLPFRNQ